MSSLLAGLNDLFSQPSVFLSTPRIPTAANSRVLTVKKYQFIPWLHRCQCQSKLIKSIKCTNSDYISVDIPASLPEGLGEPVPCFCLWQVTENSPLWGETVRNTMPNGDFLSKEYFCSSNASSCISTKPLEVLLLLQVNSMKKDWHPN